MSGARGPRPLDTLALALALGLLCGGGEAAGLWLAQSQHASSWAITFTCGAEIAWVAPLVDALLFVGVALGALLIGRVARRSPFRVVFALLVMATAYDWRRIDGSAGRAGALALAAAVGVVAWLLARSCASALAKFGRLAAPPLVLLAALVGGGVELAARWREDGAVARSPQPEPGARDVLVVVLDTIRADHLSAYGYARKTTPTIDRLAAEGVRFDACFSTSAWTLPAHASLLTGRLCFEHGALLGDLDATWPVLPEAFAAHGWRTGAFSGNLCFFHRGFGFGRGFGRFDDFGWSWKSRVAETLPGRDVLSRLGPRVRNHWTRKPARAVDDAYLAWLDRAGGRPCFAVLNWFDAHDPYEPPRATAGRFKGDGVTPGTMPPLASGAKGDERPWTDAELDLEARRYDECLLALDQELARLLGELAQRGRLERTTLVLVGDHGEAFGERGARLHRGSLHREQAQVPLVLWAPGLLPAGAVVAAPVSLAAIPATLLELCQLDAAAFPGPSLLPVVSGDDPDGESALPVIGEMARHPWPEYRRRPCYTGAMRSLVRGRWHYVWHEQTGAELYDWRADPREEHDLAAANPAIVTAFAQALEDALGARTPHRNVLDAADLSNRPELAGIGYAAGG